MYTLWRVLTPALVLAVLAVLAALAAVAGVTAVTAGAEESVQTDWSGGPNHPGPVPAFEQGFDAAAGAAWLPVPGQLALASLPRGDFSQHAIGTGLERGFGISTADIDGDGDVDVLGGAGESYAVLVWYNDGGNPPTWTEQWVDDALPGATSVYAFDVNGDSRLDLVAGAENPGNRIVWYRNDGGTPIAWTRFEVSGYFPVCCMAYAGDVNGDGHLDILGSSWTMGDIAWWENSGTEPIEWTRHNVDTYFAGAHSVYTVDLDDDGDQDVLGAAGMANRVAWWRNDGGDPIVWTEQILTSSADGARQAFTADFDGDGDLDVIAAAADENRALWWRNDGGDPIVWTEFVIDEAFVGGHSVWPADIDGDGDVDALGAEYSGNEITWWENLGGDPIAWTAHSLTNTFSGAATVGAGDLRGDGKLEVVGAALWSGEFAYWDVTRFGTGGELVSSILDAGVAGADLAVDWTAMVPAGTGLALQVRSAADPQAMGAWSAPLTEPGVVAGAFERFLQYRIVLTSADPDHSPVLGEVCLTHAAPAWVDPSGPAGGDPAGGDPGVSRLWLESPVRERARVHVHLAGQAEVAMELVDAAGRRAAPRRTATLAAGEHALTWDPVRPGVYWCRLRAAGQQFEQRVVVLR